MTVSLLLGNEFAVGVRLRASKQYGGVKIVPVEAIGADLQVWRWYRGEMNRSVENEWK